MNPFDPQSTEAPAAPLQGRDPFTAPHRERLSANLPSANLEDRLAELEHENRRLHTLIAELLIKNQQLRREPIVE